MARQIAEALEAAHERGIIHRDLKPANIKLTPLEKVKVLDFGLAKSLQDQQPASLSNSPTLMSAPVAGMVLGTASYMSPEQAKGKATDRTADVWAFGCVLYEMLTAHPVFEGETVGEIFGAVFRAEPEWNRLPPDTPEAIRRLLRRSLRKDSSHRLQSVGDARIEIEDAQEEPRLESGSVAHTPRFRERLAWMSILILITAFAALADRHRHLERRHLRCLYPHDHLEPGDARKQRYRELQDHGRRDGPGRAGSAVRQHGDGRQR